MLCQMFLTHKAFWKLLIDFLNFFMAMNSYYAYNNFSEILFSEESKAYNTYYYKI